MTIVTSLNLLDGMILYPIKVSPKFLISNQILFCQTKKLVLPDVKTTFEHDSGLKFNEQGNWSECFAKTQFLHKHVLLKDQIYSQKSTMPLLTFSDSFNGVIFFATTVPGNNSPDRESL